jgi:hypothetical protein
LGHAGDRSRAVRFLDDLVSIMTRDAIDVWIEQQPDVSDTRALRRWLDAMPEVRSQTSVPAPSDEVVYKTIERPGPPIEPAPQMSDWADVARSEALQLVEALAEEVGTEIGKLERRVRELENQLGLERRIRELELKIIKLSADMEADHSRTAAPLIPLKGGRGSAA